MFKNNKFAWITKMVICTTIAGSLSGCYLKLGTNKRPVVVAPAPVVVNSQPAQQPAMQAPNAQGEQVLHPTK